MWWPVLLEEGLAESWGGRRKSAVFLLALCWINIVQTYSSNWLLVRWAILWSHMKILSLLLEETTIVSKTIIELNNFSAGAFRGQALLENNKGKWQGNAWEEAELTSLISSQGRLMLLIVLFCYSQPEHVSKYHFALLSTNKIPENLYWIHLSYQIRI